MDEGLAARFLPYVLSTLSGAAPIKPGLRVLPVATAQNFKNLGEMQRGLPEQAMLKIQNLTGGGILNPVVEHSGDLVHRMSHMAPYNYFGASEVGEKVPRVLRFLNSPYGFEREMGENVLNTAAYRGVDPSKLRNQIDEALYNFGMEHAKLPAYNEAQEIANNINMNLGNQNWYNAVKGLGDLKKNLTSSDAWDAFASQGLKK